MKQILINLLPFLTSGALIFFAVYAKGHWMRATAGSLLLVVWLLTAVLPYARLSYLNETTEAFIRKVDHRIQMGEEPFPKEALNDSIDQLNRGEDTLEVLIRLTNKIGN